MSNTSLKTTAEWKYINWRKLEKRVYKLQKRIFRASNRGDVKAVRRLQKTLMKSWSARALAVRKVTQDNTGKKTAGVDADIAKCFDKINHEKLLEKLKTFPTIRRQIKAWLKAGVIDRKQWFPASEGTPQGGVISPLLANIALHGMENRIKQAFPRMSENRKETWFHKKGTVFYSPQLIRYADDFVILHEDITVVQRCREIISEWLIDIGLELKPSKTRIAHTLYEYEQQKPGFDFLGFKIRQYKVGKHHSKQGFKTIITPSQNKLKIHYEEISKVIDAQKAAPQSAIIKHLNPIIRGWANYYSTVVSKETYSKLDHYMYLKLRTWANRRHPNKNAKYVVDKYWKTVGGNNWEFAAVKDKNLIRLLRHSETPIVRHVKVKGEASVYDGQLKYWSTRMGKSPGMPKRASRLLKQQKGKCAHCELFFRESDVLEVDHITPKSKGGRDEYKNLQLLHRHCHDQKTARDGSIGNKEIEEYRLYENPF